MIFTRNAFSQLNFFYFDALIVGVHYLFRVRVIMWLNKRLLVFFLLTIAFAGYQIFINVSMYSLKGKIVSHWYFPSFSEQCNRVLLVPNNRRGDSRGREGEADSKNILRGGGGCRRYKENSILSLNFGPILFKIVVRAAIRNELQKR